MIRTVGVRAIALTSAVVIILAACSAAPSPDPTSIKGKFDVGGRSLYVECSGSGSPTVVMDAGLGNTHDTWRLVAPMIAKHTRTCTYDRANLGASDPAAKPRSSAEVIADLDALLKAAAISGPYVLVGHSFGGLSMRLFAAEHPADVVGIVLVDPTPVTFVDRECAIVTKALCDALRKGWEPSANPEGLDFFKTVAEVLAAGPLPTVPLVVLAATNHHQAAITDSAIEQQIETLWRDEETKLAASVAGGTLTVVTSGHDIELLHPAAVIDALNSVLAAAGVSPS
ncbi:MAG: alpha/beta hydrolase [Chloroflexota bacterium]